MAADLIQVLKQAGFRGPALQKAWAIAMRESGGNPQAFNGNASTGDKSYGLFQINMIGNLGPARLKRYGLTSERQLLDPVVNARVAYEMSKGGKDFGAWGIGPNAYKGAPPVAYQRYQQLLGQFPGGGGSVTLPASSPRGQSPALGGGAQRLAKAEAILHQDDGSGLPMLQAPPPMSPPMSAPAPLVDQVVKANPGADPNAVSQQLTDLYSKFGDWSHAVAAFHSNPAVVSKYGGVPPIPEVQAQTQQVMQGAGLPDAGAAPQGSPTAGGAPAGLGDLSAPALSPPPPLAEGPSLAQEARLLSQHSPLTRQAGESQRIVPDLTGVGATVVHAARSYLGTPYKWGGTSRQTGIDCSGFVQSAYKDIGITLPRTTYEQVKVGMAVSLNHLQPGDVIFTEPGHAGPNHEGLYVGNGMVQESPHTGTVNSLIPLKAFLGGGFVAARRYLGVLDQPKGKK